MLETVRAFLDRFLILPLGADITIALWVLHTYCFDNWGHSPVPAMTSPEKRCGKTLTMELTGAFSNKPITTSNITGPALFRTVEAFQPTLFIDEADTFLSVRDELRGILNSGHQRSTAFVMRCVGDDHKPHKFSTWAPKAVAIIGRLPSTLEDRAIVIPMRRKARGESVDRFRRDLHESLFAEIRSKCARWATDNLDDLKDCEVSDPDFLNDRLRDSWRPLLTIAEVVGGDWPEKSTEAARLLSGEHSESEGTPRIQILQDIRDLFEERQTDRLPSCEITDALGEMEDRPWPEWKSGRPITKKQLASLLRPFGVDPTQFRVGHKTRGYRLEDFEDAFSRYLPDSSGTPVQPAPSKGFQAKADPVRGGQVCRIECAPK